jgi:naphthalene 1,2-dioxygenase system ferredoxin subunit
MARSAAFGQARGIRRAGGEPAPLESKALPALETRTMADLTWIPVLPLAALNEGEVTSAVVADREVALYLVDGQPYATDNQCTHGDARLSDGFVMDHCIECPLHQGQFDIRTGEPLCEPATEPIRTYPVRVADGGVEVGVPAGT